MNIFIMVLVFLFMAGYYFLDSPSQRVQTTELEYAINKSDMRSVAECANLAHTAAIKKVPYDDVCVAQYNITTKSICMNQNLSVVKCELVKNKKPEFGFIITSTSAIPENDYNSMLEIIENYYPDSGVFGVFMDGVILSGGGTGKRTISPAIIKGADLQNGQLVYQTQFEIPDVETEFVANTGPDIKCPSGTIKAYKFARWQCVEKNTKTACAGDKVWDSDLSECVADESRRPLCGSKQTAVMVDDVWQCLDPFSEQNCGVGMISRLNYNSLEWECVEDPSTARAPKKCVGSGRGFARGSAGTTLRVSISNCTDCEEMVTDPDTCETKCIPSPLKLNDFKCYPNASTCTGPSRAFYFGFPDKAYAAQTSVISGYTVPIDVTHSQNRKFNCLDCGNGKIDTDKSKPPFIAVCE